MSTILKALKRSEASRPRDASLPLGQVPDGGRAGRRTTALWLAAAALGLAAAAAGSWWFVLRDASDTTASESHRRHIAEVSLPARPSTEAEPDPSPAREAAPTKPQPGDISAEPDPAGRSRLEPDGDAMTGTETAPQAPAAGAPDGPAREGPSADTAGQPPDSGQQLHPFALLPRLGDLPPGRRENLPRLTLNAHVHAPEPAKRFVLINLSRYGEGDYLAPGLFVAAIYPGGVVLEDDHGRFVLPRP